MDFSLWTEVEFAQECAVAPHQDFEKAFFIICKVLVGLGFGVFFGFNNGPILMLHFLILIFCTKRIKN